MPDQLWRGRRLIVSMIAPNRVISPPSMASEPVSLPVTGRPLAGTVGVWGTGGGELARCVVGVIASLLDGAGASLDDVEAVVVGPSESTLAVVVVAASVVVVSSSSSVVVVASVVVVVAAAVVVVAASVVVVAAAVVVVAASVVVVAATVVLVLVLVLVLELDDVELSSGTLELDELESSGTLELDELESSGTLELDELESSGTLELLSGSEDSGTLELLSGSEDSGTLELLSGSEELVVEWHGPWLITKLLYPVMSDPAGNVIEPDVIVKSPIWFSELLRK
jgi:hypothetical protein